MPNSQSTIFSGVTTKFYKKKLPLFLFFFLVLINCDPFNTGFNDLEPAKLYVTQNLKEVSFEKELTIMSWNIKFSGGRIDFFFDCFGDRVLMEEEEVYSNLDGLIKKINQVDPDILLLQEADINSKRSGYIDNVKYILENSKLNYASYASQWKADFVPSDGLGRVDSGNAILSKWPIKEAERIAMPLVSEQDSLTRYFYLKRNILKIKIELTKGIFLFILNTHTDAYGKDGTKEKQLIQFKALMDKLKKEGVLFVAGGDFNTLPPFSTKKKDFPDSVCKEEDFIADDYSMESEYLKPFYTDYEEAISEEAYLKDEEAYFTHSTDKNGFWNRKIDFLFSPQGLIVPNSGLVHQDVAKGGMETMVLSDHAPLTMKIRLK